MNLLYWLDPWEFSPTVVIALLVPSRVQRTLRGLTSRWMKRRE